MISEIGFNIGDSILVKCGDGMFVITKDSTRTELIEAEKAFMEEETRKLHERFLKEKKELHAGFVAERQCSYGMVVESGLEAANV